MSKPSFAHIIDVDWQRSLYSALLLIIWGSQSQYIYAQPATPKFQTFQSISPIQSLPIDHSQFSGQTGSVLSNDPYTEQNRRLMQQGGMTVPGPTTASQNKVAEVNQFLKEDKVAETTGGQMVSPTPFQNNFQQFLQLNPDSFSITKAVYLSESAYYDHSSLPPYSQFETAIRKRAELVKQILRKEGLNERDNIAANYAIQKIYSQENQYYDSTNRNNYLVKRLGYDFDDYMGDKDWTKMFVTKLLHTGTGQCHSLPLLYLCIAEQLHAKAYLSLSPNHSFIQYFDKKGNRYNFEATNGNLVSQTWLAQSNFVTATALKNKTYLDTLSSKKLYAQFLGDFLLSYLSKMGHYDNFSSQLTRKILAIDSTNIIALMEWANLQNLIFQKELKTADNPPQNEYGHYPRLYAAYKEYEISRQKVEQTGFQEMPKETYQQWLKSLDNEKQKQQNRIEQEKMQREIKELKNRQSTLMNRGKG